MQHFRHIYLYAKGYYEKRDVVTDLRRLIAHDCLLDFDHVTVANVIHILCKLVWLHLKTEFHFSELMRDLLQSKDDEERIYHLLCVLSVAEVRDGDKVLMELGEADPEVLPLKGSK